MTAQGVELELDPRPDASAQLSSSPMPPPRPSARWRIPRLALPQLAPICLLERRLRVACSSSVRVWTVFALGSSARRRRRRERAAGSCGLQPGASTASRSRAQQGDVKHGDGRLEPARQRRKVHRWRCAAASAIERRPGPSAAGIRCGPPSCAPQAPRQPSDDLLHQQLGRRGAGGQASTRGRPSNHFGRSSAALSIMKPGVPRRFGQLAQAVAVGAGRAADHDDDVDLGREHLHRVLAVLGGVADVLLLGSRTCGKRRLTAARIRRRRPRSAWSA